jgi:hypothetical protein
MSKQDKEAGWKDLFPGQVEIPPLSLLDQVRNFLQNQGSALSPQAKKNLLEYFEANLAQFEPLLNSGKSLYDIGSQILYAWEDRRYLDGAMYGSRQDRTMKFAEPEDLRQNNHDVEDMYEQGREDAASGKAPLEEGDAAYMNGYNEHKTSSVDLQRAWRQFKNQNWYDGTVASVSDRMEVVEEWKRNISRLIRNSNDNQSLRIAGKIISEIDKEYETLSRTSMALGDFELDDYLDSMPALTVAKNYDVRVSSDGTADLGYSDGSWMFEAANAVNKEAANRDWDFFTTVHASEWTEDRPSDLLNSEPVFRDVAISYVEGKTAAILDVRKRAKIIDDFVTTAEKTRRQMRRNETSVRKAMTSTSKKTVASEWPDANAPGAPDRVDNSQSCDNPEGHAEHMNTNGECPWCGSYDKSKWASKKTARKKTASQFMMPFELLETLESYLLNSISEHNFVSPGMKSYMPALSELVLDNRGAASVVVDSDMLEAAYNFISLQASENAFSWGPDVHALNRWLGKWAADNDHYSSKKTSSRKVEASLDVGLTRTAFVVPYGVKDYNTDDSFGI